MGKATEMVDFPYTITREGHLGDTYKRGCRPFEAECRMVEMLKDPPRNVGVKGSIVSTPTLAELGLTKRERADAQMMVTAPEDLRQEYVEGKKSVTQVRHEARPSCAIQPFGPQAMVSVPPGRTLHDSVGEVEGMGR